MSWVRVPLVTLKKEAVSNETKRYSLYFGMTGMSMVPAEIYHDYWLVHQKYGVAHNNILFVKYIINEVGETVCHRI